MQRLRSVAPRPLRKRDRPRVPIGRPEDDGHDQVAEALALRTMLPAEQRPVIGAGEEAGKELPLIPVEQVDRIPINEREQPECERQNDQREDPRHAAPRQVEVQVVMIALLTDTRRPLIEVTSVSSVGLESSLPVTWAIRSMAPRR